MRRGFISGLLGAMLSRLAFNLPPANLPPLMGRAAGRSRTPGKARPAGYKLARKAARRQVTLRHS